MPYPWQSIGWSASESLAHRIFSPTARAQGAHMPTYQYACTECRHAFEQVQSFSDDSLSVCPECSGRLRKVFNAVGVVFKGSGFYRNDSRAPAPTSANSSADASSESDGAKTKTDETPAKSTEAKPKPESKPATADTAPAKASTPSSS